MMGEDGSRMPLGKVWESTRLVLPESRAWTDRLTRKRYKEGAIALAELLATLPVALLESARPSL
jgi:maltooligosyltrehalose synthase